MKFLSRRSSQQTRAGTLYLAIVAQARQPGLYRDCHVPDTVEGRFELVTLHCWLVLRRMRQTGRAGEQMGQALLDYMFDDLDRSIREIGVGDMSIGKYMKRLGKSFYGRAAAYDKCLDAGDLAGLAEAVKRNVLGTAEDDADVLQASSLRLAAYIAECDLVLAGQDAAALDVGQVRFAEAALEAA